MRILAAVVNTGVEPPLLHYGVHAVLKLVAVQSALAQESVDYYTVVQLVTVTVDYVAELFVAVADYEAVKIGLENYLH